MGEDSSFRLEKQKANPDLFMLYCLSLAFKAVMIDSYTNLSTASTRQISENHGLLFAQMNKMTSDKNVMVMVVLNPHFHQEAYLC